MAISFVQQTGTRSNPASAGTIPVTLTNLPTAGNTLIAHTRQGGGFVITSVTDPRGNTWNIDAQSTATNAVACLLSCNVVTPYQAGDIVTFNVNTAQSAYMAQIVEYTGFLTSSTALDRTATAQGAATLSATVGPTVATTANNEIVITAIALGATATFTAPSGYTERATGIATPRLDLAELTAQPTGSTPSASWSWTPSTNYGLCLATYKAAATSFTSRLALLGVG